jgi:hypothetical protein
MTYSTSYSQSNFWIHGMYICISMDTHALVFSAQNSTTKWWPINQPWWWRQQGLWNVGKLPDNMALLMMEAARPSETLANFYQTTWRYNPKDSHLCSHCRENLKSYWTLIYIDINTPCAELPSTAWFRSRPRAAETLMCDPSRAVQWSAVFLTVPCTSTRFVWQEIVKTQLSHFTWSKILIIILCVQNAKIVIWNPT